MRLSIFVVALGSFAAALSAQTVKIESPQSLSITVSSDAAKEKLRVFYTPKDAKPDLTDIGPLRRNEDVFLDAGAASDVAGSLTIRVEPKKPMKPGDTYSGSLVFAAGTTTQSFTVTVTRATPAFTATLLQTDVCLTCGEPKSLPIQVTNSGSVPIVNLRVGSVTMSDATRRHRWLPSSKDQPKPVTMQPGDVQTLLLPINAPYYAGDYATNIELLANDARTTQVAAVIRTRGPGGGTSWPPILFLLTVILGAVIAHALEGYYGGGGGAIRDKALISLHQSRGKLERIAEWAVDWENANAGPTLTWTRKRIADAMQAVGDAIADANAVSPQELQTRALDAVTRLDKRRRLQRIVDFATTNGLLAKVGALDQEDDSGDLDQYEKTLNAILTVPFAHAAAKTSTILARAQTAVEKLNWRLQTMKWLRRIVLIVVSLATAYVALYHGKCSYGSVVDYITTFFWALGLTQAGNALIAEGTSKYKPATE